MPERTLNIVLMEYPEYWSAQCLQYDIGAQAQSLDDVMYELQRSIMGHFAICNQLEVEPFSNLPAAPRRYWKLWDHAKTGVSSEPSPFRLPASAIPNMPKTEVRAAYAC